VITKSINEKEVIKCPLQESPGRDIWGAALAPEWKDLKDSGPVSKFISWEGSGEEQGGKNPTTKRLRRKAIFPEGRT
jgi:hypothetical protein